MYQEGPEQRLREVNSFESWASAVWGGLEGWGRTPRNGGRTGPPEPAMRLLRGRWAGESPLGCGGRGTLSGGPEAGVSSDTAGNSLAFGEREEERETTGRLQSRSLPRAPVGGRADRLEACGWAWSGEAWPGKLVTSCRAGQGSRLGLAKRAIGGSGTAGRGEGTSVLGFQMGPGRSGPCAWHSWLTPGACFGHERSQAIS